MERFLDKSDLYKSLLEKSLTITTVCIVGLLILAVALAFVFVYWRKTIVSDFGSKRKAKQKKKGKRKNPKVLNMVEWYVALVVVTVAFLFALTSGVQYIKNLRYDITNEAFVLHDDGYSVIITSEPVGKNSYATRYYLSFDNGVEVIEIAAPYATYSEFLQEGMHDDVAFVYSEKSEKLLDMWRM